MKEFFSKQPMKTVRFFGKIYGLEANYYVVETEPSSPLPDLNDPIVAKSIRPPEPPKPAAPPAGAAPEGQEQPEILGEEAPKPKAPAQPLVGLIIFNYFF